MSISCEMRKAVIFLIGLFLIVVTSKIHPTNLVCQTLGKEFADFEYCYLKVVNRSYGYGSVKAKLYKIPVKHSIRVGVSLHKFSNGYRPFLYQNLSIDACAFLKRRNDPIFKLLYDILSRYSNMNHTCPFNHDLIVDKLEYSYVDHVVTNVLPFPKGKYCLKTIWSAYNVPRALVDIYAEIL